MTTPDWGDPQYRIEPGQTPPPPQPPNRTQVIGASIASTTLAISGTVEAIMAHGNYAYIALGAYLAAFGIGRGIFSRHNEPDHRREQERTRILNLISASVISAADGVKLLRVLGHENDD